MSDAFDSSGRFRKNALQEKGTPDGLGPPGETAPRPDWRRFASFIGDLAPRRNRITYHPQVELADCGPAALFMALRHLDADCTFEDIRAETRAGRDGTSAKSLVLTARRYGVQARGVRLDLASLRSLPRGSILFWNLNHFVVLEYAGPHHLVIVDPAAGRRRLTWKEADHSFSGVAIELLPGTPQSRRDDHARKKALASVSQLLPMPARWLAAMFFSAVIVLLTLLLPAAMRGIVQDPNIFHDMPIAIGLASAGMAVAAFGAAQVARAGAIAHLQSSVERLLTVRIVGHMMRLPMEFFASRHPGDLAQRARFGSRVRQLITPAAIGAAFDAILVLTCLLAIGLTFGDSVSVIVFGWVIALLALIAATWRRQQLLATEALTRQTEATNTLHEMLDNMRALKSLGAEDEAHERWAHRYAADVSATSRRARHSAILGALFSTIQFGAPVTVLVVGAVLSEHGTVDAPDLIALSALTALLFGSLLNLSNAVSQVAPLAPELARVADIVSAAVEPDSQRPLSLPETRGLQLELDAVSFRYPGASAVAIRDVSLLVSSGSYLGILGPSGCGKTTLANVMGGLVDPSEGTVRIGNVALNELNKRQFRSLIGYVDQGTRLITGSIADNLRLAAPTASDSEMRWATQIAEIDDDIQALPMGYDTVLGIGGEGLSGGQRQRITLARALLRRPPLLLLDEATSAVDPETERSILKNLRELGCTLVVIAHRLNLVAEADQVIWMQHGRVADMGSPAAIASRRRYAANELLL